MAQGKMAPDGLRELRTGECVVDCDKARALFEAASIHRAEEKAAQTINISRGVLRRILGRDGNPKWSIVNKENVRAFAMKCGGQIADIEWSGRRPGQSQTISAAISSYVELWRGLQRVDLGPYVPLTMRCDQAEIDLGGLVDQLARNPNLQVIGPSGSGKTHLLTHLALTLSEQGFLPVTTRAGHFTGHLPALLDQAIASATTISFAQLSGLSAAAGLRPVIIVDAINECPPNLRTDLIKALQELRIHFHAPIVISGQTETALPSTLAGPSVKIDLPDLAQKRQLVETYLSIELPKDAEFALNVIIASAQDAKVWAEVFEHSDPASSRYVLYGSFVRRRLGPGPEATIAYRALGKLAAEMREQFVFSIPEATATTTIARAIGGHAHEGLVEHTIKNSGLLHAAAGRTGFRHELLQNFFATEDLLLEADALNHELVKPVNAELAEFVIGGLAGARDIEQILGQIGSSDLLSACLSGRCGALARRTVEDRCRAAIDRLGAKITAASFDCAPEGREQDSLLPLTIDTASWPQLQQDDWVYLEAAVMAALDSQLDNLLGLFSRIDKWIEGERQRLRARYPHKKIAWRGCMFTAIYCHPIDNDVSDVRQMVHAGRAARLWRNGKDGYHRIAAILANHASLSPGQLYFLIEEFSSSWMGNAPSLPCLYVLAQQAWRLGIYHLRLATAHMLVMEARHVPEEERVQFVKLAEGWLSDNPFFNSIVIDVLKAFGALHGDFTPEQASAEFKKVIEAPLSQSICEQAFTLYRRLFDHPYEDAYCEAFNELNSAMRAHLLARAVFTEATWSMSFSFLVGDLAKNPDAETIPALQRLALAPKQDTSSVQYSVSTFVSAVTALARLRASLPEDPPDIDSIQMAWRHARHILYSLHRPGITREDYAVESEPHWKILHELHAVDVAMRIVHNRSREDDDTASRFLEWSSSQLLPLCRDTMVSERKPVSSLERLRRYRDLSREHIEFALATIEAYGDRSDLPILTALLDKPQRTDGSSRSGSHSRERLYV